jgi:SSS family solute:Na+ symporter
MYGVITFVLGVWFTKRSGTSIEDYFVAGRSLPWWVAGTSIAATWFATDAPLATASLVRQHGVFGNWLWWYEATGVLLMVFFYAKLWRRSRVITDAEFIELRYSGRPASFLRGFTAIYHGVIRNCVVMGWVMLAMVKFSKVLLGWDPIFTLSVSGALAIIYTMASGLWGVVLTDMFQFVTGLIGSIILAVIVLSHFGGPSEMAAQISALPDAPAGVLDLLPSREHISSMEFLSYIFLIGIVWIRSGQGDGYLAQRLFATKNEQHSIKAAFWFTFLGIVVMTWPWIVVGLGSLLTYPISTMPAELAADPELAYPMMLSEYMPAGLKGLLVASFLAAFMSTMDTHLCWGGSYLINDIYKRFINKTSSNQHYVKMSRLSIPILVMLAILFAWQMDSIERAWIYIIDLMAGIGMVWLLRWYWWRVNAWAEISSMAASLLIVNGNLIVRLLEYLQVLNPVTATSIGAFWTSEFDMIRTVIILLGVTVVWLIVIKFTQPTQHDTLVTFYRTVKPGGWWGHIAKENPDIDTGEGSNMKWLGWALGVLFIYSALLGVGYLLTGKAILGVVLLLLSFLSAVGTLRITGELKTETLDNK